MRARIVDETIAPRLVTVMKTPKPVGVIPTSSVPKMDMKGITNE
jgi:hypothetical protein